MESKIILIIIKWLLVLFTIASGASNRIWYASRASRSRAIWDRLQLHYSHGNFTTCNSSFIII